MKPREAPSFEIVRVASEEHLPPGDFHSYRHLREEVREASFLESLARILNDRRAWEAAQIPAPTVVASAQAEAPSDGVGLT